MCWASSASVETNLLQEVPELCLAARQSVFPLLALHLGQHTPELPSHITFHSARGDPLRRAEPFLPLFDTRHCERPLTGPRNARRDDRDDRSRSTCREVRFAPESGARADADRGPGRANLRLIHRSKLRLYSITSSARASTVGGMLRPSAFAVFRLTTSMYFDACSTGRSAGFAPFKILSM
jgi:hypothetical protein